MRWEFSGFSVDGIVARWAEPITRGFAVIPKANFYGAVLAMVLSFNFIAHLLPLKQLISWSRVYRLP